MLKLENIYKSFGPVKAVDNVSFSISTGEVVGFLGPNGAGKTTTMRMIAGVLEPDHGRIEFNGMDAWDNPLRLKRQLGFLPENNPFPEDLLVREAISYVAELHGLKGSTKRDAVFYAIERTGLVGMSRRPVGELSKGYRQRVGLAQAIVADPRLLILDEPTEGLDPNQRHEIRDLISSLGHDRTVLLSTHVLAEVANTCSRVLVIKEGRIVADGSVNELRSRATGKRQIVVEGEVRGMKEAVEKIEVVERVEVVEDAQTQRQKLSLAVREGLDIRPDIFRMAIKHDWILYELHEEGRSLEEIFRELTVEG